MKRLITVVMTMGVALVAATAAVANDNHKPEKITICHVAGLASDPANYITLELPPQAVYGNGGHFNEDGTPQAGHEQDSLGACNPPPPPHDECSNIPGNQPEGYDCYPEEPPFDQCENIPGNQPEGYQCVETPPTPPVNPPERCAPPNPDGTYGGKDGKPGNDECKPDEVPPVTTPDTPQTVTPPAVTPLPKPEGTTPPVVKEKPKAKPKAPAEKPKKKTVTPKPDKPPVKNTATLEEKETLPYTGVNTGLAALAGAALFGGGLLLRRYGA